MNNRMVALRIEPHYCRMKPVHPDNMPGPLVAMVMESPRPFISRNSRCPCGSGKRVKRCCLKAS